MNEYGRYGPDTLAYDGGWTPPPIRQRALERQTFAVTRELPVDAYRNYVDDFNQQVRATLTAYIYYESMGKYTHSWTHPTTWWDHFKRDHFPKWLLAKYPAKYTTESVTLDARAIYPDWNPPNGYTEPRYIIREM